jgi:Na+/proline symporter
MLLNNRKQISKNFVWTFQSITIVVNDVLKKQLLKKTDKQRLFIAKMATCLCSVLAVAFTNMNEQEIFRLNMLASIYSDFIS